MSSVDVSFNSMSYHERSNRVLMLGGSIWALSIVVAGVSQFVTDAGKTHGGLGGQMDLATALLQTIGAMMVAATDADVDLFAKKHPRYVVAFALAWIVLYRGLSALTPPILVTSQLWWLDALPFVYLLLRFKAVLQMRDKRYPRFSDLVAYSLALDLGINGVNNFLYTNTKGQSEPKVLSGTLYILSGGLVFGVYCYFRGTHARRLALSTTIYAYLLAFGVCSLAYFLTGAAGDDPPLSDYAFAIIHITSPLAYFFFSSLVYPHLAHYWLEQRSANADHIAQEQSISPHHGNLAAVTQAISTGADLNAHVEHEQDAADEFTLLTLACFNCHEDAVDLLLSQDSIQVNKGSLRQHWTPLYVAAMRGHSLCVGKLIVHGANVHVKTEDEQSALLAATTFRHTQIVQQLLEAGARKDAVWMGVDASAAAKKLGHASILVAMRSYESHFQGYIRDVRGCACVASWPGIYSKSW
jgi:hypothetical protein